MDDLENLENRLIYCQRRQIELKQQKDYTLSSFFLGYVRGLEYVLKTLSSGVEKGSKIMKMELKKGRIVAKSKNVIQKGERTGEIKYALSVSDSEDCVQDIAVSDDVAQMWDKLVPFTQEYDFVFDYSPKAFNGKAYIFFTVDSVVPSAVK